ncbi:hypothetical protein RUND412_009058 [Rhizina undulata]
MDDETVAAQRLKSLLASYNFYLPDPLLATGIIGGLPETAYPSIQEHSKGMHINLCRSKHVITRPVDKMRMYHDETTPHKSTELKCTLLMEIQPTLKQETRNRRSPYREPKCTVCEAWHPEEKCWWAHPELVPEGWRKGLKKAANEHPKDWIADSGSSNHMQNDRASYIDYKELSLPEAVYLENHEHIPAIGTGTIRIQSLDNPNR